LKAHAALTSGDYARAIKGYSTALELDSGCLEALFNRAVSYLHLANYELALQDLLDLASDDSHYDPEVYSSLAICHQATGQPDLALKYLDLGITRFPEFVKGYVIRGHLQLQAERVDKAITDFHRAVLLDMKDAKAYIGLGDCFKQLGDCKSALNSYSQAISLDKKERTGLVRRALVYLSRRQFTKADRDLTEYLRHSPNDAEAQFYRGQVLLAQGQDNEASLALEQAIKYGENSIFHKAIFFLGFIKIQHKDFYGALHTFDRAPKHKLKEQVALESYAEAVVAMMKRKYADGVQMFSTLIKRNSTVMREFIASCLNCRAFGLSCINKHSQAVKDLLRSRQIRKLDTANLFNLNISSAFLAADQSDFKTALKCVNKAILLCPKNAEPYCYKAIILMQATSLLKTDRLEQALQLVTKAIELKGSECEFFCLRALVLYVLRRTAEAVADIETAMDKSEENDASYLMIRGLCFGQLRMYEEAAQDFMYAVKINNQVEVAYAYIAKCFSLLQDSGVELAQLSEEWLKPIQSLPQAALDAVNFEVEDYALSLFRLQLVKVRPEVPWLNRLEGRVQFTDEILDLPTLVSSRAASSLKSVNSDRSSFADENEPYEEADFIDDDVQEFTSEEMVEPPRSL
jgi:tetratricopeptide (TPR) repeat protein